MAEAKLDTKTCLALIFDFDDTLVPDSTIQFLKTKDIKKEEFYLETERRMKDQGEDPGHAYLNFVLDEVRKKGGRLKDVSNAELEDFGAKGLKGWFEGIPEIFKLLKKQVESFRIVTRMLVGGQFQRIEIRPSIEFYIISGGFEPLVKAAVRSKKLDAFFGNRVIGCTFGERNKKLAYVKRAVSFTEKTRYLFAINKGVFAESNPFKVNFAIPVESRPVPFQNMIYVGDGLTDIPCFSVLQRNGGYPIAVVPNIAKIPYSYRTFVGQRQMSYLQKADYIAKHKGSLGHLLRELVKKMLIDMNLKFNFLAS